MVARPRNKVTFNRRHFGFRFEGRSMRGLGPALSAVVYRQLTDESRATAKCSYAHTAAANSFTTPATDATAGKQWRPRVWGGGGKGRFQNFGMKRGLAIHRKVETFSKRLSGQTSSKRPMKLDTQSNAILNVLHAANLIPCNAEVPVAWSDGRVATRVDLVCVPRNNMKGAGRVVVEMKTGRATSEYFAPRYMLCSDLRVDGMDIPAPCILSQMQVDFLQLSCEARLFSMTHGKQLYLEDAFLVHSPVSGVASMYRIPLWALQLTDAIFRRFAATASYAVRK